MSPFSMLFRMPCGACSLIIASSSWRSMKPLPSLSRALNARASLSPCTMATGDVKDSRGSHGIRGCNMLEGKK